MDCDKILKENDDCFNHIGNIIFDNKIEIWSAVSLKKIITDDQAGNNIYQNLLSNFSCAVIMGIAYNSSLSRKLLDVDANLKLEKVALEIVSYLERKKHFALIVHPEDEFDPVRRFGLISLKMLAKSSGIGWQGKSFLIVSEKFGPIYRLIAVLTNLNLTNRFTPVKNKCQECNLCVENCPTQALTSVDFVDHPRNREEVLNINKCRGDKGCEDCLIVCPWPIPPSNIPA